MSTELTSAMIAVLVTASAIVPLVLLICCRPGRKLPHSLPKHWLLGHALAMGEHLSTGKVLDDFILACRARFGGMMTLKVPLMDPWIALSDPQHVEQIVKLPKSKLYVMLKPVLGEHSMVLSEGAIWRKQRDAFTPGFSTAHLKGMYGVFTGQAQAWFPRLDRAVATRETVHMHDIATRLTMEIICRVFISTEVSMSDEGPEAPMMRTFKVLLEHLSKYMDDPANMMLYFVSPWVKAKTARLRREFEDEVLKFLRPRMALAGQPDEPQDILSLAMKTAVAAGQPLTEQEVLDQCKTFLVAGHDTTASAIAWCVYLTATHPAVEAKLRAEIREVMGAAEAPTYDQLGQLSYLGAILKEALRLYPPAGFSRHGQTDTRLGGYDVHGCTLWCSTYAMQRAPDVWGPDAGEFRPERWLDDDRCSSLHPYTYIPFSKGPRDCIGQRLAGLEVRAIVAMLFQRYRFQYAGELPETVMDKITAKPKYGVPLKLSFVNDKALPQ